MENNKTKIVSMVALFALAVVLIGATYAYFAAQTGEGASTDVKINANTVDTLTFETGSAINIDLDQDNFAQGKGNKTSSTFATAMLTANSKTNSVTEHYYLYLDIYYNNFIYTQDVNTPEILLILKDSNNNVINSIDGLEYKTVVDGNGNSISGFDITVKDGLITLFNNREITTTSSVTEKWNVSIVFINYDKDQSKNAGNRFDAKLKIQKNELPTVISDVCSSGNNLNECLVTLGDKGASVTRLYHHDDKLVNSAGDNSYRYSGGDYILTEKAKKEGYKIEIYYGSDSEGFGLGIDSPKYLINADSYQIDKNVESGYLLKDNVKNFVCFGSNESTCPDDNLYRIVGIFDGKVKLVKYTFATSDLVGTDGDSAGYPFNVGSISNHYRYSTENINGYIWAHSTGRYTTNFNDYPLSSVNLNTNYLNNIGESWANKIAPHDWRFVTVNNPSFNAYDIFRYETDSSNYVNNTNIKINLMYVSDYAYAPSLNSWKTGISVYFSITESFYEFVDSNWMFMGTGEAFLNYAPPGNSNFYGTLSSGIITFFHNFSAFPIRPTFYLIDSIKYVSGTGTQTDPIRIN